MASSPRHLKTKPDSGTRQLTASALVSLLVAAGAGAAAAFTGSWALAAVAAHAGASTIHQLLLRRSARKAARAGDADHPASFGRHRSYWALQAGIGLHLAAGAAAIAAGVLVLADPQPLEQPEVVFATLGAVVAVQLLVVRAVWRAMDDQRGDAGRWRYVRHARSPQLPIATVEATAGLVAPVLALAGDAWGAIAVGSLGGVVVLVLVTLVKSLLIGGPTATHDVEAIRGAIEVDPDVLRVLHVRTEHLGPDEVLVGAKIELQHQLSVGEAAGAIDRIERAIRTGVPSAQVIYLEPDVSQEHRVAGFVEARVGHIDPDDPDYAEITGLAPDDDIWS
jgi:divalent metal cation (Fe/Co/Zn/Cd) transporter